MAIVTGKVVGLRRRSLSNSYIIQGIKSNDQHKYNHGGYSGSNGSYSTWGKTEYELMLDIEAEGRNYEVEVRDQALKLNERSKVTDSFISKLKDSLSKKHLLFKVQGNEAFMIEESLLKINS